MSFQEDGAPSSQEAERRERTLHSSAPLDAAPAPPSAGAGAVSSSLPLLPSISRPLQWIQGAGAATTSSSEHSNKPSREGNRRGIIGNAGRGGVNLLRKIGGPRNNKGEASPLLPLSQSTAETKARSGASNPSVFGGDVAAAEEETQKPIKLGRFATILCSDAAIGLLAAVILIVLCTVVFPKNFSTSNQVSVLLMGVAGWLLSFILGYWTGRWHAPEKSSQQQRPAKTPVFDRRASLRPSSAFMTEQEPAATHHHTILSKWFGKGSKLLLHPEPLRVFRRSPRRTSAYSYGDDDIVSVFEPDDIEKELQFGRIPLSAQSTTAISDYFTPTRNPECCSLQGMDIFLTDTAVESVCSHPAFIDAGLRDKPMLVVNATTHIANMILYFELPAWVQDWEGSILEDPADAATAVALKRFFRGTDEHRNARFMVAPAVVDAPLPVKILAPSDATPFGVVGTANPGKWKHHDRETSRADGRILAPALELNVDLAGTKLMRNVVGLVKRHLRSVVLDVALLIAEPDQKGSEVVIGCFRLDHVDMASSPDLPITIEEDVQRAHRASMMILQASQRNLQLGDLAPKGLSLEERE